MDETPDPKKDSRDDGSWWTWFAALFTNTDPARAHDSGGGGETSGAMPHDGGHHDGGSGSGGDGGGGDGGGGGGD